ncbi:FecR family protein [Azohydromonas aeria]|uniref:FecR family protein n=1 Tax=Azohydromonas aeria TaxID=2590212 RepID=UPI0018DFE6B1|nr:FecR domain-containing protein [Azohydromonas aeria]
MPPTLPSLPRRPESTTAADADEREFEAFAQSQDPLDIEAATWVTRKRNGLDEQGEARLQAWLDADPRHAEAFEDMDATFGDVKQLPDADVAQFKAGLPHADRTAAAPPPTMAAEAPARPWSTPVPQSQKPDRQPWLTGLLGGVLGNLRPLVPQATAAGLAFAMVGAGWMGWEHWRRQPVFEQAYATARGQQLTAGLPDGDGSNGSSGSRLQLDTATRTEVRLYRDHREVRLQEGQAMFAVRADAQRPFHVYAGALRITVVGTRFSVRHTGTGLDAGQTVVSVEEGRVRVAPIDGAQAGPERHASGTQAVELTAGQSVVADAQGVIGPVASLPPSAIAAWRDTRLSFDQTPLGQAIAEFERYGRTGLVVRDPAVGALPVGGSYSIRQWQRFAETLPQVLPVRLVRRGEVTEVVAR